MTETGATRSPNCRCRLVPEGEPTWTEERGFACCGGYAEHRYRCEHRVWPATATPEIRREAIRGDCIGPAHAEFQDTVFHGLDYEQRKKLTAILARVWDDGYEWGRRPQEGSAS